MRSRSALLLAVAAMLVGLVACAPAGGPGARPSRSSADAILGSQPHSQADWLCIADLHAQGIPIAKALDECAISLVGPGGERVGAGTADPFGGMLGRGDEHFFSDATVACGTADRAISEGEGDAGTPATKAEIDRMMMAAWKEYVNAMNAGDLLAARDARAKYERLKDARGYAPESMVGPLGEEECRALEEAVREFDRQVQQCDSDGWQSSSECRRLAALLFNCTDPTVSLTTGDYECGGTPSDDTLTAAMNEAYRLCSAVARIVDPGDDPCKPASLDKNVVQAIVFEHTKCDDPYSHWADDCAPLPDLSGIMESIDVTPGFHDVLVQLCKVAGGPACSGAPGGDSPNPDPRG